MKRYLAFKGDKYYPGGGWYDFAGDYDEVEQAIKAVKEIKNTSSGYDWYHVIDTTTNTQVAQS